MLIFCVTLGLTVAPVRQRNAVTWIQTFGGSVAYDYQVDDHDGAMPNAEPPGSKWLMKQLGIDFFDEVVSVTLVDSEQVSDVSPLAGLTSLEWLNLEDTQVSDLTPLAGLTRLELLFLWRTPVSDLTPLAGLTRLEWLALQKTQVSDVTPLAGLTSLVQLNLDDTPVSDLTPLAGLTSLKGLGLDGTQVSDVTALARLTNLEVLKLNDTLVSQEDYEMLREALPKCRISWSPTVHLP